MMKLRIATGLGLVLFMATMIGRTVKASQAKDDEGGVTLASLAGKSAGRASGFETLCFNATFTALAACASVPPAQRVPYNVAEIFHSTRDAAGNACAVETLTPDEFSVRAYLRQRRRLSVFQLSSRLIRRPGRVLLALKSIMEAAASGRPSTAQAL